MIVVIVTAGSGQWKRNKGQGGNLSQTGWERISSPSNVKSKGGPPTGGAGLWEGRCWSHTRTVGQVSTLRHHLKPQLMKYAIEYADETGLHLQADTKGNKTTRERWGCLCVWTGGSASEKPPSES